MASRKAKASSPLHSEPFTGVRSTFDPFDGWRYPDTLNAAVNFYFSDAAEGGSANQRPGSVRWGSVSSGGNTGQAVYCHEATDGTNYNFLFINGKVYRQNTDLTTAPTDVTPLNVVISTTARIYCESLNDEMIVNDGVNKPWRATSLGSTPIVATVIEYQTPATLLSIGSNDVRLANTAFVGSWSGTQATFAANAVGTSVGALGQIAANTWGIILVEATNSTTLAFTAAFNAGAGYATEALAIAALPARTLGRWYVGYVTVRADAGAVWIANTDAFAGGTTGNQAQTTNYYAGEGPAWSAFGQQTIYYGAVFFIGQTLATVAARTSILWSEPNLPAVGYQQTDYDNLWELTQTGSDQINAVVATNDALYYARRLSWGAVMGPPGVNFQGTATHDGVAFNIGCVNPATVQLFGNYVYFVDAQGRPYRFPVGGGPDDIWRQGESIFTTVAAPTATSWWSVIEPNLNLYIIRNSVGQFFVFDAMTGKFGGRWTFGSTMAIGGILRNASDQPRLAMIQDDAAGTAYLWRMGSVLDSVYTDNGANMSYQWTTQRMGYLAADGMTYDRVHALVTYGTSTINLAATFNTSQASSASANGSTVGTPLQEPAQVTWVLAGLQGRGIQMICTPSASSNSTQLKLFRVEVVPSGAYLTTPTDY